MYLGVSLACACTCHTSDRPKVNGTFTAVLTNSRTMRTCFERRDGDAFGRIGELTVPRADTTVETPALLPVINPHLDTIAPRRLESAFDAEIIITNAYIIHGDDDLSDRVIDDGLHEVLDFSGVIVTDSGSFQLSEYGEIDVTTDEILAFQRAIGSDVATPVDLPTPPDVPREQAETELEETMARLERSTDVDHGDMLVNAPIQGSTYPTLRERAANHAYGTDLDVFPIGGVVPLMNEYRFDDVVDVIAAAKRGLGADAPVHLFGAGHPMMFALAVAMGCDLFDSAAYAIYARDDRYLTVSGTRHLADPELDYLPCSCPTCTDHTADDLRDLPDDRRERALAEHNLAVSFEEIRRIKGAIRSGTLLELVEQRARSHPAMLDGYRAMLEYADRLERRDPASKGAFFYLSHESARRPEVYRHHRRLERLTVPPAVFLTEGSPSTSDEYDESWRVLPPFGPFPRALSKTYPLTAEVPIRTDQAAIEAAATGVARLVNANPDSSFTLGHRGWPSNVLESLPDAVETVDLTAER